MRCEQWLFSDNLYTEVMRQNFLFTPITFDRVQRVSNQALGIWPQSTDCRYTMEWSEFSADHLTDFTCGFCPTFCTLYDIHQEIGDGKKWTNFRRSSQSVLYEAQMCQAHHIRRGTGRRVERCVSLADNRYHDDTQRSTFRLWRGILWRHIERFAILPISQCRVALLTSVKCENRA